jgi:benzoyl-CoA reductase/2-hydroxyglutaryl-CoA dehydratase subunit BcrC/BadD/HgdB
MADYRDMWDELGQLSTRIQALIEMVGSKDKV